MNLSPKAQEIRNLIAREKAREILELRVFEFAIMKELSGGKFNSENKK